MGVRLPLLVATIFILASAMTLAASCADDPYYQTLVCGSTPDSDLGLGAVDICNVCYPCGASDGVCPEDFYNDGVGRGSCRFCPDPDCQVQINGTVQDSAGSGVSNASIIALYEPNIKEEVALTANDGTYLGPIRTGYNKIYVQYQDYDSKIVEVDIERSGLGVVKTVDFTGVDAIQEGSCSSSCTDNFGSRCKASCNGINGCQFSNAVPDIITLCDDKLVNSRVFLPGSDTEYVVCCQGSQIFSTEDIRIENVVTGFSGVLKDGANDLVTFTQRTRSSGERVNLQVAVWGSADNN